MIERDKLRDLVKSYLPQANNDVIEHISDDVIRDTEAVLHSMVRQAVAQERENLYKKSSKV